MTPPRPTSWTTAARRAILCRDWPLGVPVAVICSDLAAMDGAPLPKNNAVSAYVDDKAGRAREEAVRP